jgi:hypothetical protein
MPLFWAPEATGDCSVACERRTPYCTGDHFCCQDLSVQQVPTRAMSFAHAIHRCRLRNHADIRCDRGRGRRHGDGGGRESAERPVPGYVEEELRGYLECGVLCFGFARALCTGCGQGFVVAFSCKGRGVCPSCNGRHMAQTAAHLVDHVMPSVPVRQWVISVPKRVRGMLADRPAAVAALTRIFVTEIERLLCAAAGVPACPTDPPGRSGLTHQAGASPRDPLVQPLSPARRRGRRSRLNDCP